MKLSLIVPSFNEELRIEERFSKTYFFLEKQIKDFEIILVNDGSKDKTEEVLEKLGRDVKEIFIYVMPFEIEKLNKEKIMKRLGKQISIFAVNGPKKFDPNGMSKKAIPGKPGVYVE